MATSRNTYPLSAVRTLALHTQGLSAKPSICSSVTPDAIYNTIRRIGCVQIDSLSVVHRSQYIVLWSRLGGYDIKDLDKLLFGDHNSQENTRRLFEYWLHAASIIPLDDYRYRLPVMRKYKEVGDKWNPGWAEDPTNIEMMRNILEKIRSEGPMRSGDFKDKGPKRGSWWDWKPAKLALEQLYNRGDLMIANRSNFHRVYDIRERVLPDWVDTTEPPADEATKYILESSLRSLGVCKPSQIADYTHMKRSNAKPFVKRLIDEGSIRTITAYLSDNKKHELLIHRDNVTSLNRAADGEIKATHTTFLSPFDNLFWAKGRDVQFWDYCQTLEAYKPKASRKWGYFCLPILHNDRLVGRFDPKLDRKTKTLYLKALYLKPSIDPENDLISAVSIVMRDFMHFHAATDIVIEHSVPFEFGQRLLSTL